MNAMALEPSETGRILPADLAEVLGAVRLTHLALDAVQAAGELPVEFQARAGRAACSYPMLLTLLSYAYARGVHGSDEIEGRLRTDADFRYLGAREFPEAETLRHFRRREWPRLNRTLSRLLKLAATHAGMAVSLDFESEAALRMERAAAADSLALDC
ncbi:MAG: transposase [Verrucomicrobia bacterium]|nr:transposase [Verrucomicrobiota bacterium]MBN8428012.1 transposase [Xanthomonadales bacterium]